MNKVMMDLMTVLQTDNFIDDTEYMLFQVSQHLLKMLDFDNIEGKGKKRHTVTKIITWSYTKPKQNILQTPQNIKLNRPGVKSEFGGIVDPFF